MRLPFPVRFPIWHVCIFAAVLSFVQVAEGTRPLFSLYCFLYILFAALAFNLVGGLSRPSGAYIFFFSFITVIVGLCVKAYLGEPADSNLVVPMTTMKVYLAGSFGLLIAAFISRRLTPEKGKLQDILPLEKMNVAATGCLAIGLFLLFAPMFLPGGNGSLLSALIQINRFMPMAFILGVTYQVRKSGGRSSLNTVVLVAFAFSFVIEGLWGLSKQGMLTPLLLWFICAAALRYRLSVMQAVGCALGILFVFVYLVPYVQYTRTQIQQEEGVAWSSRVRYLENIDQTKVLYEEDEEWNNQAAKYHYFSSATGIFDRLQMFGPDDSLISVTDIEHPFGLTPLWGSLLNVIPHVFWPDKPFINFGNTYAHEVGSLPPDDMSTGVSFSPVSDAFHEAGWTGVLIMCPILWILLFVTFDSLCGDTRKSPWSLLMAAYFAHMAPESMVGGIVWVLTLGLFGLLFVVFFSAYVLPVIGRVFVHPEALDFSRFNRRIPPPARPVIARIPLPQPPA